MGILELIGLFVGGIIIIILLIIVGLFCYGYLEEMLNNEIA